ncbi:cellulose synthase-like protein G2 isoform X2 [Coffea eugenioides]|uniref:cellulose synthase-like protein G2 isoform X2 n=1 Tax=Coffea eugenioides TaxID=49369 RepID=UPI000F60B6C5|nr:cellulose synthase-like protein G2 isoform X2 [Coffea eugenioides]
MEDPLPLHSCHVQKSCMIINRFYIFVHGTALLALLYYRVSSLLEIILAESRELPYFVSYLLVFASELVLSFLWFLSISYRWRPVSRSVFPERLPEDQKLPAIDVFICTADPEKEPSVEVMNTVISAMALDYPPDKLHVYLSDDGGSPVTLGALREAWKFARFWLPFCTKYGIKTRCPEAYFSKDDDCDGSLSRSSSIEFIDDKKEIQKQYAVFKERVLRIQENTSTASKDHPPSIELRVSSMLSNSPYILILDCDMYCNDSSSARQAMCFHLDKTISPKLAYVQFPQKFHNISSEDIYDSQLRLCFSHMWYGADGLKGPTFTGTCFYMKRMALYGTSQLQKDANLAQLQKVFGPSNDFIISIYQKNHTNGREFFSTALKEMDLLASCSYEKDTEWGEEIGFRYLSVVEDFFTSFMLQCKGWTSVYINPPKPSFLGSATTNLSDYLVQHTRWYTGLVDIVLSKYSPLIYGAPRMSSILQCMYISHIAYYFLNFFPLWCLAIIPQLCLLQGIPLYPEISNPFFLVFVFVFLSSNLKDIQEVLADGFSIRPWIYDQRMWMIRSVGCYIYSFLNAIQVKIGMRKASFKPTNKVADEGQFKRYLSGIYDFQASTMFIAPICTLVILNVTSLLLGAVKIVVTGNYDEMFIQAFISFFIVALQYPVIEAMFFRKDSGRISESSATLSALLAAIILVIGSLLFMY